MSPCSNATHDWQHLLLQQNFAVVLAVKLTFTPGSTKNNSLQPSLETATETTSYLKNVGRLRRRRSTGISRFFALRGAHSIVLQINWWCNRENLFICEEDEVRTRIGKLLQQQTVIVAIGLCGSHQSWARRFFTHLKCKSLWMIRDTDERWMREISPTVRLLWGWPSWLYRSALSLQPTLLVTLVFFDEHLTFSDQITALSKSCYYHIRELRCIRQHHCHLHSSLKTWLL